MDIHAGIIPFSPTVLC